MTSGLVISEIFGGGGASASSPYSHDYVVIHNNSSSSIVLDGYSLQTTFGGGTTSWDVTNISGTLAAGGYYLVQLASGGSSGAALPTPDAVGMAGLGYATAKVAIVSTRTALSGNAPQRPDILDFVGYGTSAASYEGARAPSPSQTTSITRLNQGTQDTDNNANDFAVTTPSPRNTGSAPYSAACYVTGTLIRTLRGDVAVENLRVGDVVVTASGEPRPIRWIGHRTLDCARRPAPGAVLPVRIAAGALGPNRPARDLLVSPGHALCLDILGEVLVPAHCLVNGATITQECVDAVTYWHVELDGHDILIAEGQPAESYLDLGNRGFFAEADVVSLDAAPDGAEEMAAAYCRPFHEGGPLVALVRERLRERARTLGWSLRREPLGGLHLVADGAVVTPDVEGLTARFILPVSARDVWLVSQASVPAHVEAGSCDGRSLGVCLGALSVDDGLTGHRAVSLAGLSLGAGFHGDDSGDAAAPAWLWTDGRAQLAPALWAGCRGHVFLRVELAAPALPRWVRSDAAGHDVRIEASAA